VDAILGEKGKAGKHSDRDGGRCSEKRHEKVEEREAGRKGKDECSMMKDEC